MNLTFFRLIHPCDRRTDRRTDGRTGDSICALSIYADARKNLRDFRELITTTTTTTELDTITSRLRYIVTEMLSLSAKEDSYRAIRSSEKCLHSAGADRPVVASLGNASAAAARKAWSVAKRRVFGTQV